MPVSRNSTLLEEVHPMINHDNHSPHEAYLSQQGREQPSASSSPRPSSNYGNDSSEGGDDDEDSTVLASMARVWPDDWSTEQQKLLANGFAY